MGRYRVRQAEVEAFQLADGRYMVASESPRFIEAAEFERIFEPLPERRDTERRSRLPKATPPAERRAGPRRHGPTVRASSSAVKRAGRPPAPWFCTDCNHNTAGPICGSCGAERPAVGARVPAKTEA